MRITSLIGTILSTMARGNCANRNYTISYNMLHVTGKQGKETEKETKMNCGAKSHQITFEYLHKKFQISSIIMTVKKVIKRPTFDQPYSCIPHVVALKMIFH